ncbi:3-phosphoshikimate 1-carboxyvinyltransferase [Allosphingosinicella sp.]|uniref:3-phosphoshikimate 1-carboxyvinyltransferase n=1 Tax=Allosphingosinicella sp. TaxID=2823234 RepID=UPI0039C89CB1
MLEAGMKPFPAQPMSFSASGPLKGAAEVPGDKSISHRALMLAAVACGRSRIAGLSEAEDVASTAAALRAMGVKIERADDGAWEVHGVGTGALLQPRSALDMGNSGTSARLLMGLIASHPVTATFTGDASLSRRPMDRVIAPLQRLGAEATAAPGGRLPLTLRGVCPALPLTHRLTVASAQVKSALLLAGLNTPGITTVIEEVPTRDHTERMLQLFGAEVQVADRNGTREISVRGEADLRPQALHIPADPSAAAFLAVAALIVPGSAIRIEGVGVNPMRMGFYDTLREMGADLHFSAQRMVSGEPVADLEVRHAPLSAVSIDRARAPAMIDEFPIFFIAAAFAEGESRATGLSELRVKESDRIAAMAAGLQAIGAEVAESDDGLIIRGSGGAPLAGGATIASRLDHRISMSFAVAGLRCAAPVTVDDMNPVSTSFPGFAAALQGLAA